MTEPDWDRILTLGASLGEKMEMLAAPDEAPCVAAAAYSWVLLRRLWGGEERDVVQRWRQDMPDVLARYAERIGITREDLG